MSPRQTKDKDDDSQVPQPWGTDPSSTTIRPTKDLDTASITCYTCYETTPNPGMEKRRIYRYPITITRMRRQISSCDGQGPVCGPDLLLRCRLVINYLVWRGGAVV
jgi:hypothetical protein